MTGCPRGCGQPATADRQHPGARRSAGDRCQRVSDRPRERACRHRRCGSRPGGALGGLHPLRARRQRRRRTGRGRRHAKRVPVAVPRPRVLAREDRDHRPADLRSEQGRVRSVSLTAAGCLRAKRLGNAGLYRQDAPVDLVQPRAQRRADRLDHAGARGTGVRRCGVRLPRCAGTSAPCLGSLRGPPRCTSTSISAARSSASRDG